MVRISVVLAAALAACGPSHVTHDGGQLRRRRCGSVSGRGDAAAHADLALGDADRSIDPGRAQRTDDAGLYASPRLRRLHDRRRDLAGHVDRENPAVGSFTNATLGVPGFAAATAVTSKLTASLNNVDGLAQITVVAFARRQQDFFFILPYQDTTGRAEQAAELRDRDPRARRVLLHGRHRFDDRRDREPPERADRHGAARHPDRGRRTASSASARSRTSRSSTYGADERCGAAARSDQPFMLRTPITATDVVGAGRRAALSVSTDGAPIGCGYDCRRAAWSRSTRPRPAKVSTGPSPTSVPANHTGIGGVGFRTGTMPVIVAITDATRTASARPATCSTTGETDGLRRRGRRGRAHARSRPRPRSAASARASSASQRNRAASTRSCTPHGEYHQDLATTTGARVPPGRVGRRHAPGRLRREPVLHRPQRRRARRPMRTGCARSCSSRGADRHRRRRERRRPASRCSRGSRRST